MGKGLRVSGSRTWKFEAVGPCVAPARASATCWVCLASVSSQGAVCKHRLRFKWVAAEYRGLNKQQWFTLKFPECPRYSLRRLSLLHCEYTLAA